MPTGDHSYNCLAAPTPSRTQPCETGMPRCDAPSRLPPGQTGNSCKPYPRVLNPIQYGIQSPAIFDQAFGDLLITANFPFGVGVDAFPDEILCVTIATPFTRCSSVCFFKLMWMDFVIGIAAEDVGDQADMTSTRSSKPSPSVSLTCGSVPNLDSITSLSPSPSESKTTACVVVAACAGTAMSRLGNKKNHQRQRKAIRDKPVKVSFGDIGDKEAYGKNAEAQGREESDH